MKQLVLALLLLGVTIRGYFVYQQHQLQAVQPNASLHGVVSQLRAGAHSADAEADAVAGGTHSSKPPVTAAKVPVAAAKAPAPATPSAEATARTEIEAALAAMHVTTIMPGSPGVFILDKQDYTQGDDVPLPKGRKARVVAVENDGVQLACEGIAFHLDAPAAPDLATLRKKK